MDGRRLSLYEAADLLGLEREGTARLGRWLRLAPSDHCIPQEVITEATALTDRDQRYGVVLRWLLQDSTSHQTLAGNT